jgi:acyl-CoA-binding protein
VHPNEKGYKIWGDHLAVAINKVLLVHQTSTSRQSATSTTMSASSPSSPLENITTTTSSTSTTTNTNVDIESIIKDHFDMAVKHASKKENFPIGAISNEMKLELYGLYKQATMGSPVSASRPSVFNPVARAKFDVWKSYEVRNYIQ